MLTRGGERNRWDPLGHHCLLLSVGVTLRLTAQLLGLGSLGKHVEDPEKRYPSAMNRYSDLMAGPLLNKHYEPHLGSTPCRVD